MWPITVVAATEVPDPFAALTSDERARAEAIPNEKRRREWLLGRVAAKNAVARLLPGVAFTELRCGTSDDGAPLMERLVAGTWRPLELGLSLTHGHGLAAAWALEGGLPGVDLERVKPRPEGTFRFYLDESERAPLMALQGEARDIAAVVLWSLKEAAWKTLRPHRGVALLDFEVQGCDLLVPEGETVLRPRGPGFELAKRYGIDRIEARYRRDGDLVFSWARAI